MPAWRLSRPLPCGHAVLERAHLLNASHQRQGAEGIGHALIPAGLIDRQRGGAGTNCQRGAYRAEKKATTRKVWLVVVDMNLSMWVTALPAITWPASRRTITCPCTLYSPVNAHCRKTCCVHLCAFGAQKKTGALNVASQQCVSPPCTCASACAAPTRREQFGSMEKKHCGSRIIFKAAQPGLSWTFGDQQRALAAPQPRRPSVLEDALVQAFKLPPRPHHLLV